MNKDEFINRLKVIETATSLTGKCYNSIHVSGDKILFIRGHKTKSEKISISELFNLYSNELVLTNTIARSYISGRVQSPAVAILNQLKAGLI